MRVSKCGDSLAIRLPIAVVNVLEIKKGDDSEIQVANERVFELEKKLSNQSLLARLQKYRGLLLTNFKFDRLDAHENQ